MTTIMNHDHLRLYHGSASQFIEKVINTEIAQTLTENFIRFVGHRPAPSEITSWQQSLRELAYLLRDANITAPYVVLEFRIPNSPKRIDVMLIGVGDDGCERALVIELKQWSQAARSDIENLVLLKVGGQQRQHLHPSDQAFSYTELLKDTHTAFYEPGGPTPVALAACSYLHNAHSRSCGDLLDPVYARVLERAPLFTGDQREELAAYIRAQVGADDGHQALQRVLQSRHQPSRALLQHVADVITGQERYHLIDEQLVAFHTVLNAARRLERQTSKAVVIVTGGPGTGKSVIAMQLLAALAREQRNVVHATGSKAFTTNLRATVTRRDTHFFKYFNNFTDARPDEMDVLIADEAHRIRTSSNTRFTPAARRSARSQIQELIDTAKVSVFFLDEHQVVRPGEVGTLEFIRQTAVEHGAAVETVHLAGQFRCGGSDAYLDWLNGALGLAHAHQASWRDDYDFQIVDSPSELEARLQVRMAHGESARMVAGFCWPWSDPYKDGSLVADVQIGEWTRPWNRKEKGSEPPDRHPYTLWATRPEHFEEIGCIYSAQGFEFDHCGVIVGRDLVIREGQWRGDKTQSHDTVVKRSKEQLTSLLQHTYRVLLSRGMRSTLVYFEDPETRAYFEQLL